MDVITVRSLKGWMRSMCDTVFPIIMGNGTSFVNGTQNITNSFATSFSVQPAGVFDPRTELGASGLMSEQQTSGTTTSDDQSENLFLKPYGVRYVNYVPKLYGNQQNDIKVWWFPSDFCQSRLGDRKIGSNACTLIAVILAYRIHDQGIGISGKLQKPLSRRLISALAESIVDGNEIHQHLVETGKLSDVNLTLPEAMKFYEQAQKVWELNRPNQHSERLVEWRFYTVMDASLKSHLFEKLHQGIIQWECQAREGSNLYIILITGGRSVLLVYHRHLQKITLIDSHGHLQHGAAVSQTDIGHLQNLCDWYDDVCKNYFYSNSTSFEISFLHFDRRTN